MAQAQVASIVKDAQVEAARVPPQSIEAEQSVLGGLLLDNAAWDRVADVVTESDFYRADHRLIFQHIGGLIEHGKPADALTVAESLERSAKLAEIGGNAYLGSLAASTPSAANIRRYAEIVRERSIMRNLASVGTEIADAAYSPAGRDAKALVDEAESKVFQIAEAGAKSKQGFVKIDPLLTETVERIDMLYNRENKGDVIGLATGFVDLDRMTSGLQPGELVIIAARPSMGKAQPLDAKVLTRAGWKRMGDLRLGDELASFDGKRSRVSGLFPQGRRQVFRVTFSDGRQTECCAEHLWRVDYREWESPRVLSTADLMELLCRARYRNRLFIDTYCGEFGHDEALPVEPWLLGALLGDGTLTGSSVRIASADSELVARMSVAVGQSFSVNHVANYDYRIVQAGGAWRKGVQGVNPNPLKESLVGLGLWGRCSEEKFIPECYLNARRSVRAALLQGLMDTDGWIERWGSVRFCTTSEQLARDVVSLVRSLGGTGSYSAKLPHFTYRGERRQGMRAYVCNLQHFAPRSLFTLTRKVARAPDTRERQRRLNISAIEPSRLAETQCIAVTHPQRLYITDDYIVTHNTALAMNIVEHATLDLKKSVAVFSMEMSGTQLAMRMIGSVGRFDQHELRTGTFRDEDWSRMVESVGKLNEAQLYIDDSAGLNALEVRSRARRLHRQCGGLSMIVVDYLQLMSATSGREENRATEIAEISRSLKGLAKELKIPVVALSQLNRSVESRQDKRPMMSDLRECVTGDTLVVLRDGRRVPIRGLVGKCPDVWSVSNDGKLTPGRAERVWSVGRRAVVRVALASGRTIRVTSDHRLLSGAGWRKASEIGTGDRLALARALPEPSETVEWPDEHLVLLGHLVGDGSYLNNQPLRYTTASRENSKVVAACAERGFGAIVKRYAGRGSWHQLLISGNGNRWHPAAVNKWLRDLGIFGQRSHEKRLPTDVFRLGNTQIALLLKHLWATDGSITTRANGSKGSHRVYFSTSSRGLADDVSALLLRLGIVARIKTTHHEKYRPVHSVDVTGAEQQLIFAEKVGGFGPRHAPMQALSARLHSIKPNTNVDTLPEEAFAEVRSAMRARGVSQRRMAALRGTSYGGTSHFRFAPSRAVMASYAEALNDEGLKTWAESDLFWDTVVGVEPAGEEEVFDLTVPEHSSWLADGIVSHNSGAIEQDADLILFIYRDEVYNPGNDEKRGEAEILIAKQRNGPTGKVELTFLGKHIRFENRANPDRF